MTTELLVAIVSTVIGVLIASLLTGCGWMLMQLRDSVKELTEKLSILSEKFSTAMTKQSYYQERLNKLENIVDVHGDRFHQFFNKIQSIAGDIDNMYGTHHSEDWELKKKPTG